MLAYAGVAAVEQLTHPMHIGRRLLKTGPVGGIPGTGRRKEDTARVARWVQKTGRLKRTGLKKGLDLGKLVFGTPKQASFMASRKGGVFTTLIIFGNHLAIAEAQCAVECWK